MKSCVFGVGSVPRVSLTSSLSLQKTRGRPFTLSKPFVYRNKDGVERENSSFCIKSEGGYVSWAIEEWKDLCCGSQGRSMM